MSSYTVLAIHINCSDESTMALKFSDEIISHTIKIVYKFCCLYMNDIKYKLKRQLVFLSL